MSTAIADSLVFCILLFAFGLITWLIYLLVLREEDRTLQVEQVVMHNTEMLQQTQELFIRSLENNTEVIQELAERFDALYRLQQESSRRGRPRRVVDALDATHPLDPTEATISTRSVMVPLSSE